MGAPLEYDPDTSELAPDITEYTIKLKQSHERARKLRADLAVEEQREQELSRMLKGIVTASNFTETHKKRPRRKSSIERLKVSRHLAEEALNYFEECVSISTMDGTDFSSPEDHQLNSVLNVQPKSNSRFFHKGRSSSQEPHTPADQHGHHELISHRLFPMARYSIWVDSKSQFRRDPLGVLEALLWRSNSSLALSEHGARSSLYDEAKAIVKKHKATPEEVKVQLDQYRQDGIPDEKRFNGKKALAEASVNS
nr:uncharacterized protein LOC117835493 isoform X1 [Setaria viridis]